MKRGDLVTVVIPGAYGKPRPALIIQSDLFSEHPSVTILPITSTLRDAPLFRLRLDPSSENGLKFQSDIMIDKIMTVSREKVGSVFGHIEDHYIVAIERLITLFIGIA